MFFSLSIADPCEESSLFNLDGTCVEASIEAKYAEEKPSFAFRIEAGAAVAEPAPVCKNASKELPSTCLKPSCHMRLQICFKLNNNEGLVTIVIALKMNQIASNVFLYVIIRLKVPLSHLMSSQMLFILCM